MAKTLSFTDTSPRTVKIGDTTTKFTLICGNDNVATDLTKVTSITVKLGNASGYLKSATVDPDSLTDPTTGQVTVKFNADLMTSLPAGNYYIEVWVVDSTGTSIYPSDAAVGFTINNNIQSTNGSTITTITFDDFVKAMNKAASTIAKGDRGEKGDTGTFYNSSLTTVPAFANLQTQVDNSAVGTNLLANTADNGVGPVRIQGDTSAPDIRVPITRNDSYIEMKNPTQSEMFYRFCGIDTSMHNLKPGQTYTIQGEVYVNKGTVKFRSQYQANGGWMNYSGNYSGDLAANTSGFVKVKYTFTVPENATAFYLSWQVEDFDSSTVFRFRRMKLELGSHATDWCPNPTEILTQSDVADNHILQYHSISVSVSPNMQFDDNDISHLQKLGAEVTLVSMVNINNATDSNPQLDDDARIKAEISRLQTAGIKIDMIKPHLGVNWSDGFYRGDYKPALYSDFFDNWKKILLYYAEICEQNDIPILCLGCEQVDNFDVSHAANWEDIIVDIRANYPKLLLTVAFNRLELVPSYEWPAKLDYIGTNVYPALSPYFDGNNLLKLDDLKANFYYDMFGHDWGAGISAINDAYHLPIFITETGCMPQKDGLVQLISHYDAQTPYDYHVSALFMETAFSGWMKDIPSIVGFAWWSMRVPFNFYDGGTESEAEMVYKKYVGGGLI